MLNNLQKSLAHSVALQDICGFLPSIELLDPKNGNIISFTQSRSTCYYVGPH